MHFYLIIGGQSLQFLKELNNRKLVTKPGSDKKVYKKEYCM